MTLSQRSRFARRTGGELFAVVIALFGLFAMHGWGTHGTNSHQSAGASMVTDSHNVGHARHSGPNLEHNGSGRSPAPSHDTGMLALCLAVLGAWIAIVVPLLRRRVTLATPPRLRYGPPPTPRIRDRDPPDLLALGVIRC